jgi:hypothetical protein
MSSSADRRAAAVWTLADAFAATGHDKESLARIAGAVESLAPFVRHDWEGDRAMKRLGAELRKFVSEKTAPPAAANSPDVGQKDVLAYAHMLAALLGDHLDQLPASNPARGAAWLRLNNAAAEFLNTQLDPAISGKQAARGCQWARQVETILRGI